MHLLLRAALATALLAFSSVAVAAGATPSERRLEALSGLDAARAAGAIPLLLDGLDDEESTVRAAATRLAGSLRSPPPALLRRLIVLAQVDPSETVRRLAAAAVRRRAPGSFAAKLASGERAPVAAARLPPLRPRAQRALGWTTSFEAELPRAGNTAHGDFGLLLRWGAIEAELAASFPAAGLSLGARWLLATFPVFTPFLSGGARVSFHNEDAERRASAGLRIGGGLRLYLIPPIFLQLELGAQLLLVDAYKRPDAAKRSRWSMPLGLTLGFELWPEGLW